MILHEKIVVIIPVFNEETHILKALNSVFAQTYKHFKVLIADNASTDRTGFICKKFCEQDPRFNYFRHDKNIGAAKNFEFCLKQTSSEYIIFLGGHDKLAKDFIEKTLNEADTHPSVSLVYGFTNWIDEDDKTINVTNGGGNYIFTEPLDGAERYLRMLHALNRCEAINQLIRRKFLDLHDFLPVISADLVAMCHLAAHGPFARIDKELYFRREFLNRTSTAIERITGEKSITADYQKLSWYFIEDIQKHIGIPEEKKLKLVSDTLQWLSQRFQIFEPAKIISQNHANPIKVICELHAPKVSVVMPAYNREKYIEDSIKSVIEQDFSDFEIIVIDDGSTDSTKEVVRSIVDNRISLVETEHLGGPGARNKGIEKAQGTFILWVDSDDLLAPGALGKIVKTIDQYPDADIFYGDLLIFDDVHPEKNSRTHYPDFYHSSSILPILIKGNCLPNPGTAVRRSLYSLHGGFDSQFKRCHDYQIWSRLADSARFKKVDSITCHWRQHGESLSTNGDRSYESKVIQDMYSRYPFQRLFPELVSIPNGQFQAMTNMAIILGAWGDNVAATEFAEKAMHFDPISLLPLMTERPLVSIIIPTCNRVNLLKDALISVKTQTYSNWEAVVINEGQDDIEELVSNLLENNRYQYINHRNSFGLSAARNSGLRLSSGEIVCFLDDDDLYLPHHLETIIEKMQGTNIPIVYTDADIVLEVVENDIRTPKSRSNPYQHDAFSKSKLCVQNYIPVNTWVCRWECFKNIGFFDETLKSFEDWDVLLRLARYYDFVHIPNVTVEVRRRIDKEDHMTDRERHTFPQLYRKIYERTRDLENVAIRGQRQKFLDQLESKSTSSKIITVSSRHEIQPKLEPYQIWLNKHALSEADGQIFAERMQTWSTFPNFLILTVFEGGPIEALKETIASLQQQFYDQWSLAILSIHPCPEGFLSDDQQTIFWLQVNDDPFANINHVIANVEDVDWICIVTPGVKFAPQSLSVCGNYLNLRHEWAFVYSDEDALDINGNLINPLFKPDFNLDLLRSQPYIGNFCLIKKEVIAGLGGVISLAGVQNWDMALKTFDGLGADAIGHISEILLHRPEYKPSELEQQYFFAAGKLILEQHLKRNSLNAVVSPGLVSGSYHIQYQLSDSPNLKIIITVLSQDHLENLPFCLSSLLENSNNSPYEVIVTSTFSENEIEITLNKSEFNKAPYQFTPYQGDGISPFNNRSIETYSGEYFLFLSPDLIAIQENALEEMISIAQRGDVGIVSCRIVDANKNIQHAGLIVGMGDLGIVDYPNYSLPMDQAGYADRALVAQNFSAVSEHCFLVKTELLKKVFASDSLNTSVYRSTEVCFEIRRLGYLVVWTPAVTWLTRQLITHQSTAEQNRQDADRMLTHWLPQLANDPAYNRNLSLKYRHFKIETETDVNWNVDFHDRLRVWAFPANDTGIGEYRVRAPLRALTQSAKIQSSLLPNHSDTLIPDVVEIERTKPDVILLQNGTVDYLIKAWQYYKKFNKDVFLIYAQDDLIWSLPKKHPLQGKWPKDIKKRVFKILENSDRLIVATEPLKEAFGSKIADIRLVPNYLETARWTNLSLTPLIVGKKPRVGWAGGGQHQGDLEFILPVIEATKHEVDWIFFGMCPDVIRPHIKEYHGGVSFAEYPQKLASLNLDLAVAPLEHNNFNVAKTNLRLLEYGILGWPVVCTDIFPYQNAPVTRVANLPHLWIKIIREKVHDLTALKNEGLALQAWVAANYLLEDHLDEWLAALKP